MESQAALVRTNGAVHLDAISAVDLHLAPAVRPRHPEVEGPLRLDHAFEDPGLAVLRIGVDERPHRICDLGDRLVKLSLGGIALSELCEKLTQFLGHGNDFLG